MNILESGDNMCCFMCIEVAKEQVSPQQFWMLYRDVNENDDHFIELMLAASGTSEEYQTKLANANAETRD